MKIFNTLSRKKEKFVPQEKGRIGMYLCGPTVYDKGHLGHARSAVAFDVIRKYLRYRGYKVTFVSNYTDIDDKMIKRANERGISVKELADEIIPLYQRDYGALGIEKPDVSPKATEYIPQIVELVENLLAKKIAYTTEDGIYYSVKLFKEYGKLSRQKLSELAAGARVDINENKRAPEDFALWKKEKAGEPAWDGPASMRGRPGWHIECSAMTMSILGETFDIHAGGQDLIFPHHEDEIAQSEAVTGRPFAQYWLHNGFIRINDEKMSKSLGNFFTIEDVLKEFSPAVVRYFLLSTHYRMPIDFSPNLLEQAKHSLMRLKDCFRNVERICHEGKDSEQKFDAKKEITKAREVFETAMDDDFEISRALAGIFDFINAINVGLKNGLIDKTAADAILACLKDFDSILCVMEEKEKILDADIEALIQERNEARKNKDFAQADQIRDELHKKGIILEDSGGGTVWKREL